MRYALLIYTAEELWENLGEKQKEEVVARHRELQSDAKAAEEFVAAIQLTNSATATTVRTRGSETTVLDGPFQETKELIAGLYLVDCESLDEALEYARRIPVFAGGSVEVRPVEYTDLRARG